MTAREGLLARVSFEQRTVLSGELPLDGREQGRMGREWDRMMHSGSDARNMGARSLVADSWRRSLLAAVSPDLQRAPLVLDAGALRAAREQADWLPAAERAIGELRESLADPHLVSLFDAGACMLGLDGDAAVAEQLDESNFRPGALWSELVVGTNGPGTALALRRPVHIIGAEHFCQSWHRWHCAAVPLMDPVDGSVLGLIDISGIRSHASPHSFRLAKAIVSKVQHTLAQREVARRATLRRRFAELVMTYRQDGAIALDARGIVLQTTPSVSRAIRPGMVARHNVWTGAEGAQVHLSFHDSICNDIRDDIRDSIRDDIPVAAISHPVYHDRVLVGACLLVDESGGSGRNRQAVPVRDNIGTGARPVRDGFGQSHRADTGRVDRRMTSGSHAPPTRYTFADIIGSHDRLAGARQSAEQAARSALPVLIRGGPGTGKGVFAQAIHAASERCGGPFVEVHCATLPRERVAAELFGYVDGAFTGARRSGSDGRFGAADGGTIFLDEVCELSLQAQASLLRVMQEGAVMPLGGSVQRPISVRVIAAMTRDVDDALGSGALSRDLYERLDLLPIELPPLRERGSDMQALALHFLAASAVEVGRPGLTFAPAVLDALSRQEWPGNVRELRNVVRRMASMCVGACITIGQLPMELLYGVHAHTTGDPARADGLAAQPIIAPRASPGP